MASIVRRIASEERTASANAQPSTVHRLNAKRVNVRCKCSQRTLKRQVAVALVTIACPQVRDRIGRDTTQRTVRVDKLRSKRCSVLYERPSRIRTMSGEQRAHRGWKMRVRALPAG